MDQGLAAVLGASVGVVGTLGTAVLTYAATRGQVRDQHRVAHAQWLRDARQQAYTELFLAIEEYATIVGNYERQLRAVRQQQMISAVDVEELTELGAEARRCTYRINHQGVQLGVAGPGWLAEDVAAFVPKVRDCLRELDSLIPEEGPGPVGRDTDYTQLPVLQREADLKFNELLEGARRVLEQLTP